MSPGPIDNEEDLPDYNLNEDEVNVGVPPDISDYKQTPQVLFSRSKSPDQVLLKCKIHSVDPLDNYS